MEEKRKKANWRLQVARGVAATSVVAAGASHFLLPDELGDGLKTGEVGLFLPEGHVVGPIDISNMEPHEKYVLQTMRDYEAHYPKAPVEVRTNTDRRACVVSLTPAEIQRLSRIGAPNRTLALAEDEKLDAVRKICNGDQVVAGSVDPKIWEKPPTNIVRTEGRAMVEPLVDEPQKTR